LLDCKNAPCQPAIVGAPRLLDALCAECAEHFAALRAYLDDLAIGYDLNPRLVRGLDYYTKTVFEVWPREVGAQSAIGGGGRYDGLAEALGGRPTPAIGFATGIERVIMNLKAQEVPVPSLQAARVFLVHVGDAARREAARFADALRQRGVAALVAVGGRSMRAQLRQANGSGAAWTAIIGEDELAAGDVTLKNMATGEDQRVPRDEALARLVAGG
jgi:histidyl-tRNA synthetase